MLKPKFNQANLADGAKTIAETVLDLGVCE